MYRFLLVGLALVILQSEAQAFGHRHRRTASYGCQGASGCTGYTYTRTTCCSAPVTTSCCVPATTQCCDGGPQIVPAVQQGPSPVIQRPESVPVPQPLPARKE